MIIYYLIIILNNTKINLNLQLHILINRFKNLYLEKDINYILNKQHYKNFKYYLEFLKNKNKNKKDLLSFKKIINYNNYNFSYNCKNLDASSFNSQNFLPTLYLNNIKKIKNFNFKSKRSNINNSSFFIKSLYTFNNRLNNLNNSLQSKKKITFLRWKRIYLNQDSLKNLSIKSKKSLKRFKRLVSSMK